MKATMTRNELLSMHRGLETNLKRFTGINLAYAVAKNTRTLLHEAELIEKTNRQSDEFKEYRQAAYDFVLRHCKKNEDGTPAPGSRDEFLYPDVLTQEKVNEKLVELRELNRETITAEEEREKEYVKFLQEEVDIELHSVVLDDLNDSLDGALVSLLVPFLEE